jgi:hypothetical protein
MVETTRREAGFWRERTGGCDQLRTGNGVGAIYKTIKSNRRGSTESFMVTGVEMERST